MNPVYPLPATDASEIEPPPFKRDLHSIDDIEGTKPNAYLRWKSRASNTVDDIEGTHSRPRTIASNHHVEQLYVRDINEDGIFRSSRRVDPLRPTHIVHGRVVRDDDAGMYVKPAVPKTSTRPFLPLETADIEGAQASFHQEVSVGGIAPEKRRHFINTNFIGDIAGAQPGSKAHGLKSVRMTDPLERDYVLLDGRRWNAEELAVGKSWYNAAATILAAEAAEASATMPMGRTGIAAAVAPAHNYARRILDPRDAEIAKLRGTVETLRREREVLALTSQIATIRSSTAPVQAGPSGTATPSEPVSQADANSGVPSRSAVPSVVQASRASRNASRVPTPRTAGSDASLSAAPSRPSASAAQILDVEQEREARQTSSSAGASSAGGANPQEFDPVASLRKSAAAAQARNILGVIPATRPQQNLQKTAESTVTAAMGQTGSSSLRASGRYDSYLDQHPAAPRGTNPFQNRSAGHMAASASFRDVHATRVAAKERASEVNDVRSLPM